MVSVGILRISRVVADLDRAKAFYRDALGFRAVSRGGVDPAVLSAFDASDAGALEVVMRLGAEDMALVRFARPGRPYPRDGRSDDLGFQHAAIVVSDMDAAYAHLCLQREWLPISEGGPQALPPANGAVRAFKFRDPDGHPLELLWFPPGQGRPVWRESGARTPFLGIDHSALCVASTRRSLRFYRTLGFKVSEPSQNQGPAQARLDALPCVQVRVTGLRPASPHGPGLELLEYQPSGRPAGVTALSDGVTDWVTFAVHQASGRLPQGVQDPDGHRLLLVEGEAS